MSISIRKTGVLLLTACMALAPLQSGFALTLTPVQPNITKITAPIDSISTGGNDLKILPNLVLVLSAPTNLQSSLLENLDGGQDVLTLSWSDTNATETGFIIERSGDGVSFATVNTLGPDSTQSIITPEVNTVWTYRVRAIRGTETSNPSNTVEAEGMPSAPTGLKATPGTGGGNPIDLYWSDFGTANDTRFIIHRTGKTDSDSAVFLSKTAAYTDTTAKPGVQYTYSVQALNSGGRSKPCTTAEIQLLEAPFGLSGALIPGTGDFSQIDLTWFATNPSIDHFELSIIDPASKPQTLTLPATSRETKCIINNEHEYNFTIRAISRDGTASAGSNIFNWHAPVEKSVPPAPNNLNIHSGVIGNHSINELYFDEPFLGIWKYIIERREGTGSFAVLPASSILQGDAHMYRDVSAQDGVHYTYRIKAVNSYGESSYSNEASTASGTQTLSGTLHTVIAPIQTESTKAIVFKLQSSQMTVNGFSQAIDPGKDTKPVVTTNGRTLIPIRSMVESLGGTVQWNAGDSKVTIQLNGKTVELFIGKTEASVDGKPAVSEEAPQIINGRTMLPIRFVSENLGLNIQWNAESKTITIQ